MRWEYTLHSTSSFGLFSAHFSYPTIPVIRTSKLAWHDHFSTAARHVVSVCKLDSSSFSSSCFLAWWACAILCGIKIPCSAADKGDNNGNKASCSCSPQGDNLTGKLISLSFEKSGEGQNKGATAPLLSRIFICVERSVQDWCFYFKTCLAWRVFVSQVCSPRCVKQGACQHVLTHTVHL